MKRVFLMCAHKIGDHLTKEKREEELENIALRTLALKKQYPDLGRIEVWDDISPRHAVARVETVYFASFLNFQPHEIKIGDGWRYPMENIGPAPIQTRIVFTSIGHMQSWAITFRHFRLPAFPRGVPGVVVPCDYDESCEKDYEFLEPLVKIRIPAAT